MGLLIFMMMGLMARACTVRWDRVGAGIPGKGAGLKRTTSARAEVLRLVGVVLMRLFTMRWSVLGVLLVARGCLVVVEDQFTGRVVRFLRKWQIRMENIPKILMM